MKLRIFFSVLLMAVSTVVLSAQTATVLRMTGDKVAVATLPDQDDAVPVTEGMVLPEGTFVEVGANTKLFMKTFEGAITTAAANTVFAILEVEQVGEQERTRLRLDQGDLVASLDPTKRGTHDYGVQTPKGVAAARGTTYSVSVDGFEVMVTVTDGAVSFEIPELPAPVILVPGTGSDGTTQEASPLASLMSSASAPAVRAALQATAAAVATLVADTTSGVTNDVLNSVITAAANAGDATETTTDGTTTTGDGGSLVALVAAAATQANADVAQTVVEAAAEASPATAETVVASVTREVVDSDATTDAATVATTLAAAATTANAAATVNTAAVTNAVEQSIAAEAAETPAAEPQPAPAPQPTTETETETEIDESPVEVEVPTDNIVVSPSS